MIGPDNERLDLPTITHFDNIGSTASAYYATRFAMETPMRHAFVHRGIDDDVYIIARLVLYKPRSDRYLTTFPRVTTKDLPASTPKSVRLYDHRSGYKEGL